MSSLVRHTGQRCNCLRSPPAWRTLRIGGAHQSRRSKSTSAQDQSKKNSRSDSIDEPRNSPSHSIWIPDSGWLWSRVQTGVKPLTAPLRAYGRAQEARPYVTQILSSLTIYFLGDLLSQYIEQSPRREHDNKESNQEGPTSQWNYDPHRSLRALLIGGTFSLPSYHWFLFLSHWRRTTYPNRPYVSLLARILVHQIVFSPVFNTYFFSMQSLLSLETPQPEKAWERVKETVPVSVVNSWKFWPLVTAFSFTFVRPRSRSVFGGVVAVGWQAYLGLVNERARFREQNGNREVVV